MKNFIDKVMAYFGYYPAKKLYDFPIKAPVKKKPAVKKATIRKPAVKK